MPAGDRCGDQLRAAREPQRRSRASARHFFVARRRDVILGCAGLRLLPDGVGKRTRLFVARVARDRGLGAERIGALERRARQFGLSMLRLDTRHDLVEARRLYAALGYAELPAFNDGQYAEHWFA